MKISKKHTAMRLLAVISAMLLVLAAGTLTCFAGIPEPTDYFYVADYADVLSDSTEQSILADSEYLDEQCGAQIVVATVNFTDGMDMEDYAYKLFNSWQIGSSSNNGLLILLSIGDDNYWVMPGKGLESTLSVATMQSILDQYMEPSFAVQDYDTAVKQSYEMLYDEVASIYKVSSTNSSAQAAAGTQSASASSQSANVSTGPDTENSSAQSGVLSGVKKTAILLPIIIMIVILVIFRKLTSPFRRTSYTQTPQHRSAGRQRPGTGYGSSASNSSRHRNSGIGTAAGIGAGLGLGMFLGSRNSNNGNQTPPHASAGRQRPGAGPGSAGNGAPNGPVYPGKNGMPWMVDKRRNGASGNAGMPGSGPAGTGRSTSSRIGAGPSAGRSTSSRTGAGSPAGHSTSGRSTSGSSGASFLGGLFGGSSGGFGGLGGGHSSGGHSGGGFSGSHHSGGGGSSRGGGAGRR